MMNFIAHSPPLSQRQVATAKLEAFLPRVKTYAAGRNYDLGPGQSHAVSGLSPWITVRAIDERTILKRVLAVASYSEAEKFIQEIGWRAYWKGWLEGHPEVWTDFLSDVHALERLVGIPDCRRAMEGRTGIRCFDAWVEELVSVGHLHNHARMWFASIWIFTLRLPWQLGAAFFLRHLLDGDAASNTLSWRWVAGLQTRGKNYAARTTNIARYTNGRFPHTPGLAADPKPIEDPREYPFRPPELPNPVERPAPGERVGLLLHEEDVTHRDTLPFAPVAVAGWHQPTGWRVERVEDFRRMALMSESNPLLRSREALHDWITTERLDRVVVPWLTVGPTRDSLAPALTGLPVAFNLRDWDRRLWPYATRGFFAFKPRLKKEVA